MKEYIEREALVEEIKIKANNLHKLRCLYTDQSARVLDRLAKDIAKIPAADVAPVVHGEWIQTKEPLGWKDIDCVMCSACEDKWIMDEEYDLDFYKEQWIYCHNCGAMMDGGNKQ